MPRRYHLSVRGIGTSVLHLMLSTSLGTDQLPQRLQLKATDLGVGEFALSSFPTMLRRKEVIQPQLPLRLPCYDFVPITDPTLDACLSCELA